MKNELIATGRIESLSINGKSVPRITFSFAGPVGDAHAQDVRTLSGHDGTYIQTSKLKKGDPVFNWRTWTGLSLEEMLEVEQSLGVKIPQGCLLENIVVSGIPTFSKLAPTTRLVFPKKAETMTPVVLAVWEENGPCGTVGARLEEHYRIDGLKTSFVAAAQHRRGVTGIVLSAGLIEVGDQVQVYPPAQ